MKRVLRFLTEQARLMWEEAKEQQPNVATFPSCLMCGETNYVARSRPEMVYWGINYMVRQYHDCAHCGVRYLMSRKVDSPKWETHRSVHVW